MKTEIKEELEQTQKNATDFLARSRDRSEFGDESQLGALALGVGGAIKLARAGYAEPQRSEQVKGLGYETIAQAEDAYRAAVNHYTPTIQGKLIEADQILS